MTQLSIFSAETQELLDTLQEQSFDYSDMLDFIGKYGESNFQNFYVQYVEFGERYSYEAVDAFIESFSVDLIGDFEEAYHGEYGTPGDFCEDFMNSMGYEIPDYIVVDWNATWESNLRHDFIYENGHVFFRNF
jgi:hypothetical protein